MSNLKCDPNTEKTYDCKDGENMSENMMTDNADVMDNMANFNLREIVKHTDEDPRVSMYEFRYNNTILGVLLFTIVDNKIQYVNVTSTYSFEAIDGKFYSVVRILEDKEVTIKKLRTLPDYKPMMQVGFEMADGIQYSIIVMYDNEADTVNLLGAQCL